MFRFVKTILRLITAALIIFFAVSVWKGGGEFKRFGEKLGEKADAIKLKKDEAAEKIKKLTGIGVTAGSRGDKEGDLEHGRKPVKKHNVKTDETSKKKTKETDGEAVRGESDDNKPSESLWVTIWIKIKALTKGFLQKV